MNHLEIEQTLLDSYKLKVSYCRNLYEKRRVCVFVQESLSYECIDIENYCKNEMLEFLPLSFTGRSSVRITRGLWPNMRARGQNFDISIGMLPQTLIISLRDKRQPSTTLRNLTLKKDFKRSMYQHLQFIGEYILTNL